MSPKLSELVIGWESSFHRVIVPGVGRARQNMLQERGGFGSRTPGSGDPGSGKGGRPTVVIRSGGEDAGDRVPVSAVEMQALGFAGRDEAELALGRLSALAGQTAWELGRVCDRVGVDPGPDAPAGSPPGRLVALGFARVLRLRQFSGAPVERLVMPTARTADRSVDALHRLVGRWSYTPDRPAHTVRRDDLLAVDLTERWCTSHLRVGAKAPRSRGELCDWCYRHGPLLVASWPAPPIEIVRLKVEHRKVYAHEIEPFIRAERDRQRQLTKAAR